MSQTVLPPVGHPLLAAVEAVGRGLEDAVAAGCWALSDVEVGQLFDELEVAEARLAAVKLTAVAEADRLGLARADGTPSTAGWLRQRHLTDPGTAARTVSLAIALDRDCRATAAALAGGQLSADPSHLHPFPIDFATPIARPASGARCRRPLGGVGCAGPATWRDAQQP